MKRIIISLVLFSSLLFGSSYTKKQIAEYIKIKVEQEHNPFNYHKIRFVNNYCSFHLEAKSKESTYSGEFIFNLKELNIGIDTEGEYVSVDFMCINSSNCIKDRLKSPMNSYNIFSNHATVKKLYKAFEDLTSKCKGIKELY